MDRDTFEKAVEGRILSPTSKINFGSILFQTKYTPEDMVKKMHEGGNGSYSLDKEAAGVGTSKYSVNTLNGGYIYTQVSDAPTATGGNSMQMPNIPIWAQNIALYAASGFLLGFSMAFVAKPDISTLTELSNAVWGASVLGFYSAMREVAAYAQTLLPKTPSTQAKPGVAAKAEVPIARRLL
jgi:hypothetical protein